jgi:hypothetical protein
LACGRSEEEGWVRQFVNRHRILQDRDIRKCEWPLRDSELSGDGLPPTRPPTGLSRIESRTEVTDVPHLIAPEVLRLALLRDHTPVPENGWGVAEPPKDSGHSVCRAQTAEGGSSSPGIRA